MLLDDGYGPGQDQVIPSYTKPQIIVEQVQALIDGPGLAHQLHHSFLDESLLNRRAIIIKPFPKRRLDSSHTHNHLMELCLRHNDPTQTLLMTPDGIAMYQVNTTLGQTTTISRFENHAQFLSTGRVSCVVGEVDSDRLRLLDNESPMEVVMVPEAEYTENVDR